MFPSYTQLNYYYHVFKIQHMIVSEYWIHMPKIVHGLWRVSSS
jgi:hypothetical protein